MTAAKPLVIRGVCCECGPGWHDILRKLDTALAAVAPDYEFYGVKEKFGGLRVDTGPLPLAGHDLVEAAEQASEKVCELCGAAGENRADADGWLRTRCRRHRGVIRLTAFA